MANVTLSSVKYTTIRPQEKTGDYTSGDRCTFVLDPQEIAFLDGKQSYLYVEVENTSSYSNVNATAVPPTCFFPHIGAYGLFDRMTLRGMNGVELEDLDAAATYKGLQSYLHDFDEYPGLAKVTGIAAHTPKAPNVLCSDPKVNEFCPPALLNTSSNSMQGGREYYTQSKCLPLPFGLFSAFQDEHKVYPNASLLGSKIECYLADPNQVLIDMSGKYVEPALPSSEGKVDFIYASDPVECDNIAAAAVQNEIIITHTSQVSQNWTTDDILFRVGMPVRLSYTVATVDLNFDAIITSVNINQGTLLDQVKITIDSNISKDTNVGDIEDLFISAGETVFNYNVSKIELRVLETMPSDPRAVDKAVTKGVNYMTYQLTKQSAPSSLKNQVINIPSSLTRAKSLLLTHTVSDDLNGKNENSTVYPQMEEDLASVKYQWMVKNHLTPNRSVMISTNPDVSTDNSIFYLEMSKALRPMGTLRALNDGLPKGKYIDSEYNRDLQLPMVYPLLLAPVRNSYNLVDSEPQLRLENSDSANVSARLYHIFINHVRTVKRDGDSLVVTI